MRKDLWKRGIVVGIIMLFVGACVIPSTLGKNHSHTNEISEKLMQTNSANAVEELVIYVGNVTVTWSFSLLPIIHGLNGKCVKVVANCSQPMNITYNMTYPGLLRIIIISEIILNLEVNYKIYRGGAFQSDLVVNGVFVDLKNTTIREKKVYPYIRTHTIIYERSYYENTTLNLHSELGGYPTLGPLPLNWQYKWCGQNTIVYVKV